MGSPIDLNTTAGRRTLARWDVALFLAAVLFGGIVAGRFGLVVATACVVVLGLRRGGPFGGAIHLIVFSGSVSVSHYGLGSPEWTEQVDRTWILFASALSMVALVVAARSIHQIRLALSITATLAAASWLLVDASFGVRTTTAAIVAVMAMLVVVGHRLRPTGAMGPTPILRAAIDLTLAIGIVLDTTHDLIGGFGGRGPERFGVERWIGTTLDPNEFGELALLALGLTLVLFVVGDEQFRPVLVRLAGYSALIALSGSRTAAGLLIVILVATGFAVAGPRVRVVGAAALVAVVVATIVSWSSIEPRLTGFEPIDDLYSLNGRTDIWEIALEERIDDPFAAYGYGRSEIHFRELFATTRPLLWENISTHNRLLEAWGAFGLHGAVTLSALWVLAMVQVRRLGAVAVIVTTTSIASSMMVPVFGSLRPGAWVLVPVALLAMNQDQQRDGARSVTDGDT